MTVVSSSRRRRLAPRSQAAWNRRTAVNSAASVSAASRRNRPPASTAPSWRWSPTSTTLAWAWLASTTTGPDQRSPPSPLRPRPGPRPGAGATARSGPQGGRVRRGTWRWSPRRCPPRTRARRRRDGQAPHRNAAVLPRLGGGAHGVRLAGASGADEGGHRLTAKAQPAYGLGLVLAEVRIVDGGLGGRGAGHPPSCLPASTKSSTCCSVARVASVE